MAVPRYVRDREEVEGSPVPADGDRIRAGDIERRLATATLRPGSQDLLRGLCRLARPSVFAGGGVGIDYAALLKTSVNPAYLYRHAQEVAEHLRERRVDVMLVPGLSGHPIGALYAAVGGIPAILLKKEPASSRRADYPTGSFIMASYTGDGDHLLSADLIAVADTLDAVLAERLAGQRDQDVVRLPLRLAGADDIIDKGVMSTAVSDSAIRIARTLGSRFVARHRERTGDRREIQLDVSVSAWVTPLLKAYNNAEEHIERFVGITPFAGLRITEVRVDPPVIGVAGFGSIEFGPGRVDGEVPGAQRS